MVGGREERGGAREKCEAYRVRKVASTFLMLRVQRVKLAGISCKFNFTRNRKKGKEKRTETA